jgi:hypothetical protein
MQAIDQQFSDGIGKDQSVISPSVVDGGMFFSFYFKTFEIYGCYFCKITSIANYIMIKIGNSIQLFNGSVDNRSKYFPRGHKFQKF